MLVDFEKMVDDVLDASPLVHTQSQYDAMISFTFNLGPQWINPKYNIYQYFVYGGYTEMEFVNTMGRWLSSSSEVVDGLAKRRIDEADMYLNGVYRLGSTAYVRVVFNAMGGEAEEDYVYYKTGRSLGMLPNAYRSGHYFVGWYDPRPLGRILLYARNDCPRARQHHALRPLGGHRPAVSGYFPRCVVF